MSLSVLECLIQIAHVWRPQWLEGHLCCHLSCPHPNPNETCPTRIQTLEAYQRPRAIIPRTSSQTAQRLDPQKGLSGTFKNWLTNISCQFIRLVLTKAGAKNICHGTGCALALHVPGARRAPLASARDTAPLLVRL